MDAKRIGRAFVETLLGPLAELARGDDRLQVRGHVQVADGIQHKTVWRIARWASEEDRERRVVYRPEVALEIFRGLPQFSRAFGNIMLNEGLNAMWTHLCSSSGTKWDAANAYIGVGDSATGESAAHTGLQGSSKTYKAMMASYPTYGTSQLAVWKSEFLSAEGNHAWNEFTVSNSNSDSGTNLNRKVSAQGTKVSGQVWECSLTITLS